MFIFRLPGCLIIRFSSVCCTNILSVFHMCTTVQLYKCFSFKRPLHKCPLYTCRCTTVRCTNGRCTSTLRSFYIWHQETPVSAWWLLACITGPSVLLGPLGRCQQRDLILSRWFQMSWHENDNKPLCHCADSTGNTNHITRYIYVLIKSLNKIKSARWLQMSWRQICAKPSATLGLTQPWIRIILHCTSIQHYNLWMGYVREWLEGW